MQIAFLKLLLSLTICTLMVASEDLDGADDPAAGDASPNEQDPDATTDSSDSEKSGPFNCEANGLFADPDKCTSYFRCNNAKGSWVKYSLKCPPGTSWSQDQPTPQCTPGDCQSGSDTTEETPTDSNSDHGKTDADDETPTGPFACEANGLFANPESCDSYYKCVKGKGRWRSFPFKCPEGTHWSQDEPTPQCMDGDCPSESDAKHDAENTDSEVTEGPDDATPVPSDPDVTA